MEHRNSVRIPKKLNVAVSLIGMDCGIFTASNVGYGGLFLDKCANVLKEGDFVVVSVQEETLGQSTEVPLKALVVHCSQEGVGLMWADCGDRFYGALRHIMGAAA